MSDSDEKDLCAELEEDSSGVIRPFPKELVKNHGLSLETLERLSPSIVTLQSLTGEWPPNTADSGHVPSPDSNNQLFSYNEAIKFTGAKHKKTVTISEEPMDLEASSGDGGVKEPLFGFQTPSPNVSMNRLKCTPPINIPFHRGQLVRQSAVDISDDEEYKADNSESDDSLESYDDEAYDDFIEFDDFDASEDSVVEKIYFQRPRANSCPESARLTPTKLSLPSFLTEQKKVGIAHSAFDSSSNLADAFLRRQRPSPLQLLQVGLKGSSVASSTAALPQVGSREVVRDLTAFDGTFGHKRRVLVSTMPDVVVDARATNPKDDTPDCLKFGCKHLHPDGSPKSRNELLEVVPLTPDDARRRRRGWSRPRALSCDVTMEETIGKTLRQIADDFATDLEKVNSRNFLRKMKRSLCKSFTRIVSGKDLTGESCKTERRLQSVPRVWKSLDGRNVPEEDGNDEVDGIPEEDGSDEVDGIPEEDGKDGVPKEDGNDEVDGVPEEDGNDEVDGINFSK